MKNIIDVESITYFNSLVNTFTLHEEVNVNEWTTNSVADAIPDISIRYGFYAIFFKDKVHNALRYGRNYYDYKEGTLYFLRLDRW